MLAVTDTHALVWAATGKSRKLGRRARRQFELADAGEVVIYVPTLVLAEVSELNHRGTITLPRPFDVWVRELGESGTYIVQALTLEIVRRAHDLFAIPERGDRLIAATAAALGAPLMTRDAAITRSAAVELLWD